jgi:hypothetical protein
MLIQTQCTLHKEESLVALFSARQAETANRYLPTSVLHLSKGSPVTVLRSPSLYIYYHFIGSWLIYQKVKFRFLLDTSMSSAYFCKTKLLYEASDIKNSRKRSVSNFVMAALPTKWHFTSALHKTTLYHTVCPPDIISKHAPSTQHWSIQYLQYISNGAADSV